VGLFIVAATLIIAGLLVVRLQFVKRAEAIARRVVVEEDPALTAVVVHTDADSKVTP